MVDLSLVKGEPREPPTDIHSLCLKLTRSWSYTGLVYLLLINRLTATFQGIGRGVSGDTPVSADNSAPAEAGGHTPQIIDLADMFRGVSNHPG